MFWHKFIIVQRNFNYQSVSFTHSDYSCISVFDTLPRWALMEKPSIDYIRYFDILPRWALMERPLIDYIRYFDTFPRWALMEIPLIHYIRCFDTLRHWVLMERPLIHYIRYFARVVHLFALHFSMLSNGMGFDLITLSGCITRFS